MVAECDVVLYANSAEGGIDPIVPAGIDVHTKILLQDLIDLSV